ncbi:MULTISPECIES: membrane protein [unclassified Arthrobacter]|uniref:membrane protein n=1 Tax=unclassified Arthrobacter TaxID=235627 RepID=UPI0003FDB98E|nr:MULTISPECIES: membrane protein [unclassified Arthrobacter]PVE19412.1 hypothetical protein DDA93_03935 [Arthrobacter sp. Bz4]
MEILSTIWDFFWLLIWIYAVIAFLTLLFSVVADLFRDETLSGWLKAVWLVFLVFVPFISILVYLITRGDGMADRGQRLVTERREAQAEYIRSAAGSSISDEISKAHALLDAGTISAEEYELIKQRTLAR